VQDQIAERIQTRRRLHDVEASRNLRARRRTPDGRQRRTPDFLTVSVYNKVGDALRVSSHERFIFLPAHRLRKKKAR